MNTCGWGLSLGLGMMIGAVAILMMPRTNPTRKLAKKAAGKVEDAVWEVRSKISDELDQL